MRQDIKSLMRATTTETEAQVQATAEAGQAIEKEEAQTVADSCSEAQAEVDPINVSLQCHPCVNLHVSKDVDIRQVAGRVKTVVF